MYLLGKTLIIAAGILGSTVLFFGTSNFKEFNGDIVVKKEIITGSTFSVLASQAGVATSTAVEILEKTKKVYNLAQINAGKELVFIYNNSGNLKELDYEINRDEKLEIKNISTTTTELWEAEKVPIEYAIEISNAQGIIQSSLYETIVGNNLDERLAMSMAEMFAWQIDFASQVQKGDTFKVIYEKKFRDGKYGHPGKILAAEFVNSGEKFQGYYFSGDSTKEGYYDENGNSLQKVFLKTPVQYKYISSGFSYNRLNPISAVFTAHRAIDYAAPKGTPVVSVGDGTVTQSGWNGDYGISVKIRHNEMYSTTYGHLMAIAKGIRVGSHVNQGQIIGYIGSTGQSTGPHLHYEMRRFGSLVNPFREKIPSGEPVNDSDKQAFEIVKNEYQGELAKL